MENLPPNPNTQPQLKINAKTAGELMAEQGVDASTLPQPEITSAPAPNSESLRPPETEITPPDHLLPPTAA